jgi:hypothetical protein
MRGIVPSAEPTVVLSSLARSSNPSFSDACGVELSVGTDALFQVTFPLPDEAAFPVGSESVLAGANPRALVGKTVTTPFQGPSGHGHASFAGVVVHSWIDRDPAEDDTIIARLLVDRALAILEQERLAQSALRAEDRAAKLAIDLITSRVEGEAIGILMAKHGAAREEAVRMLRRVSHASRRDLHEVASDVVRTGDLQRLLESRAGGPARRERLHIAASHGQTVARAVRDPATRPGA